MPGTVCPRFNTYFSPTKVTVICDKEDGPVYESIKLDPSCILNHHSCELSVAGLYQKQFLCRSSHDCLAPIHQQIYHPRYDCTCWLGLSTCNMSSTSNQYHHKHTKQSLQHWLHEDQVDDNDKSHEESSLKKQKLNESCNSMTNHALAVESSPAAVTKWFSPKTAFSEEKNNFLISPSSVLLSSSFPSSSTRSATLAGAKRNRQQVSDPVESMDTSAAVELRNARDLRMEHSCFVLHPQEPGDNDQDSFWTSNHDDSLQQHHEKKSLHGCHEFPPRCMGDDILPSTVGKGAGWEAAEPVNLQRSKALYEHALQAYQHKNAFKSVDLAEAVFRLGVQLGQCSQTSGNAEEAFGYYRDCLVLVSENEKLLTYGGSAVQELYAEVLFDIGLLHLSEYFESPKNRKQENTEDDYTYEARAQQRLLAKAVQAFHWCLEVRQACFGYFHPAVASVLYQLAVAHMAMEQYDTATQILLECLAILLLLPDRKEKGRTNGADGIECFQQGQNDDETKKQRMESVKEVWTTLGRVQHLMDRQDEAWSCFQEAARLMWSECPNQDHPPPSTLQRHRVPQELAQMLLQMGNLLLYRHELNEAMDLTVSSWCVHYESTRCDSPQVSLLTIELPCHAPMA